MKKQIKKITILEKYYSSPASAMDDVNFVAKGATKELEVSEDFNLKEFLRMGRILSKTEETKEELEKITEKEIDFEKKVSYEIVKGSTRYFIEVMY